jgi:hypothetical protein
MTEIWLEKIIIKIVCKHMCILFLAYIYKKQVTDWLQMIT